MMRVVTFGELMLRLQPQGYGRFVQAESFELRFGGAEANVAVSLAGFGAESVYVTKLPEHEIGQAAVNALRRYGVDVSHIVRGGERVGIYFNEKGASQRPSKCIYDRAGSAISKSVNSDFDWNGIFSGADWFHLTGVTPALGGELPAICEEACACAKKLGLTVSCDLNYRSKLWTKEDARSAMKKICQYVDVCVANEEDARDVFGIEAECTDVERGMLNKADYENVARRLSENLGFKKVSITLRTSINANQNKWAALLYDAGSDSSSYSPEYEMMIVDRLGGGDSFAAGLIYSLLRKSTDQEAVNFAAAAGCLKHSVEGDWNMVSVSEVESLLKGNASGRIQR